jgi:hypothetical protein
MTPDTALWILLTVAVLISAVGAPLSFALREEMDRAKAKISNYAALGITIFALRWITLGLWWYYAIATDQLLLAIIPTAVMVWSWVIQGALKLTK